MVQKNPGRPESESEWLAELTRICRGGLETLGYDLVEIEFCGQQQGRVLRVYIDHLEQHPDRLEEGPLDHSASTRRVTHDDCTAASRHLGAVLDVEDPIEGPYVLEVSSPGVYRPLRWEKDFQRFAGFGVKVRMREPIDGRRNFAGRLQGTVDGNAIVLDEAQRTWKLPISGVQRARLTEEY